MGMILSDVHIFCMVCGKPFTKDQLKKHNGNYDYCFKCAPKIEKPKKVREVNFDDSNPDMIYMDQ